MIKKFGSVMIKDGEVNEEMTETFDALSKSFERVEVTEDSAVSICDCNCDRCDSCWCDDRLRDYIGYEKDFEITLAELQNSFDKLKANYSNDAFWDVKYKVANLENCLKHIERSEQHES